MRFGRDSRINKGIMKNCFFSAMVREECTKCYENNDVCQDGTAIQMLVVTENGVDFNENDDHDLYDKVDSSGAFDSSMFIEDCEFQNYRKEGICPNNIIFQSHSEALDGSAGHYIYNSKCKNCDQKMLFKLHE